eukprot:PITA_28111
MEDEEGIAAYLHRVAKVVNSLKGLDEKVEESTIVQNVLRSLPDKFDSKISAIEEEKDIDTLKMDELHGILTPCEMRKGGPSSKEAAFKASKSKKGKERNDYSDESDVEFELAQFVRKLKRGSKLKGKMEYKKKGFNKKNFFSKQDESDEDEFMVIKKKTDEESDHDESQEELFMALTDDDDSGLEGSVDELLISAIEENEKLRNKIISLKVEKKELRRREDLLEAKLKEKEETCEEHEAKIVSLRKELEQIKKGYKSSQILETILKNKKPQYDKSGIGFKGESSSTKNSVKSYADALSCNPKDENVCYQKCIPDPKNEERITPKKNVESNHGHYNKYKPVLHQGSIANPKDKGGVIPRKEIDSNRGCFKTILLGHCFHCKNFGHQARNCMARRSEKAMLKDRVINSYAPKRQGQIKTFNSFDPLTKFDPIFSFCYNNGHYEQDYPLKGIKTSSKNSNMDKCGLALFAQNNGNQWFVDSGCSKHMTGDKRKFVSLRKKEGNVSFGSRTGRIVGKGAVTLINGKGKAQDALLVDGIKHNLLSVSQICDQGHKVVFSTKDCEIRNYASGKLVAKGVRTPDNIYILNKIRENKCHLSETDESWLWHKRIGHTSFENLINISKIKAVQDIPRMFKPNQVVCGPCQHGKQTRTSHKTKEHCTSKTLEIIHVDVCGPTRNQAL